MGWVITRGARSWDGVLQGAASREPPSPGALSPWLPQSCSCSRPKVHSTVTWYFLVWVLVCILAVLSRGTSVTHLPSLLPPSSGTPAPAGLHKGRAFTLVTGFPEESHLGQSMALKRLSCQYGEGTAWEIPPHAVLESPRKFFHPQSGDSFPISLGVP